MDISVENPLFFVVKPIYWLGWFPFEEVIFSCILGILFVTLVQITKRYKIPKSETEKKYRVNMTGITPIEKYKEKIRLFLQRKYPSLWIETMTAQEIENILWEKELWGVMKEIEEIEYGHRKFTKEKQKHIESITLKNY